MTAGMNVRIKVWRLTEITDDDIGGAVLTGTVSYQTLDARWQELKPDSMMLFQGLEMNEIFRCMTRPTTLSIEENDEVELVWPPTHPRYGVRFKVIKIQRDGLHPMDRRNFVELSLSRIRVSRVDA